MSLYRYSPDDLNAAMRILDLERQLAEVTAERDRLAKVVATADLALTIAVSWAGFTFDYWQNDRDRKVGKCLSAMIGRTAGYAPDTDAFHAYRQQVSEARKMIEGKTKP